MLSLYLRLFTTGATKQILRQAIVAAMVFTIPLYGINLFLESYYCAPHASSHKWNLILAMNCSHASLYGVIQGVINR